MRAEVEQHYGYREAAGLLGGISVRTVRRWVAAGIRTQGRGGLFPVRIVTRQTVLIPASAINRFLERRTPKI